MKILGIDPGKVNCGLCIIHQDNFETWKIEVVKNASKDEKIHQLIQLEIALNTVFITHKPTAVFHEGISFGEKFGVAESGMIQYIIQITCVIYNIPFTVLSNMTIRRFLGISKGEKTKDLISLAIYKKYGVEFPSQDERDAYAIAKCGEAIANGEFQLTTLKLGPKLKKPKK